MLGFFSDRGRPRRGGAERYSDLFVVAGLIAVISLMILPLPLFLLDTLVALNITFAAILLLSAVYIATPLELAVFPSVLLMSTLFRLALSVATTRMILLEADAGQIIDTFGNMVAGGNVVVGLVIFLIITVVQFMVIAKGAERVAEVAARFSLDGMPGKQMSIDSDLRSGLLTKTQAVEKRRVLELESKLYGSLDGAMKFVKGDSMASIIIILINIIGGLAIGIGQRGMPAGEAAQTYSILTIGDGLVAQVPALLSAMAAGLIVTRTAGDEDETHLGDALGRQFGSRPRVLIVGGAICALLACVPGFPSLIFCVLGAGLGALGLFKVETVRAFVAPRAAPILEPVQALLPIRAMLSGRSPDALPAPAVREGEAAEVRRFVPLLIEVAPRAGLSADALGARLDAVLDHIQLDLGVPLPPLSLHLTPLRGCAWRVMIHEAPVARGDLDRGDGADADGADMEEIAGAFEAVMRREASLFLGIQETNAVLNAAGNAYPDIVQEIARALPVPQIAVVLRALVAEDVPIRDMRALLEALTEAAPKANGAHELVEAARIGLRRHITHRNAPDGQLSALRLDGALEAELRGTLEQDQTGIRFALDPARAADVVRAVADEVTRTGCEAILTQLDLRRALRDLCAQDIPALRVLSFHELLPQTGLEERGVIAAPKSDQDINDSLADGMTPALAE